MAKILLHKKAQSFLEYTMLVIIVSLSILAMQVYIQRALNARLKQVQVELDESKR